MARTTSSGPRHRDAKARAGKPVQREDAMEGRTLSHAPQRHAVGPARPGISSGGRGQA